MGTETVLRAATGKRARVALASTPQGDGKNDALALREEAAADPRPPRKTR